MEIAAEDSFPHPQLPQRRDRHRRLSRARHRHPARSQSQDHRDSGNRQRACRRAARKSSIAAPASGATSCFRKFPAGRARVSEDPGARDQRASPSSSSITASAPSTSWSSSAKEQKLRELPRMGAKLEEKVLRSIAQYRLRTGRFLLSFANETASELKRYLGELGWHRGYHRGGQPAARQGDGRRSGSAGHGPECRSGARALRGLSARA